MPFVASLIEPVREALRFLDLIVFVPVSHQHPMHLEADGIRLVDKEYRWEVNRHFKRIYRDGLYDLFAGKGPEVLEVQGSRNEWIEQLRAWLA